MKENRVVTAIVAVLVAAFGVLVVMGQLSPIDPERMPPSPVPPNAMSVSCGEGVYTAAEIGGAAEGMRLAGCTHIEFEYLQDGFYLGRASRIVVGEN